MADAYLRLTYVIELADKDMRLLCLGLSQKLDNPDDIKAAKELQIRLLRAQNIRLDEQKAKIVGALQKALDEALYRCP